MKPNWVPFTKKQTDATGATISLWESLSNKTVTSGVRLRPASALSRHERVAIWDPKPAASVDKKCATSTSNVRLKDRRGIRELHDELPRMPEELCVNLLAKTLREIQSPRHEAGETSVNRDENNPFSIIDDSLGSFDWKVMASDEKLVAKSQQDRAAFLWFCADIRSMESVRKLLQSGIPGTASLALLCARTWARFGHKLRPHAVRSLAALEEIVATYGREEKARNSANAAASALALEIECIENSVERLKVSGCRLGFKYIVMPSGSTCCISNECFNETSEHSRRLAISSRMTPKYAEPYFAAVDAAVVALATALHKRNISLYDIWQIASEMTLCADITEQKLKMRFLVDSELQARIMGVGRSKPPGDAEFQPKSQTKASGAASSASSKSGRGPALRSLGRSAGIAADQTGGIGEKKNVMVGLFSGGSVAFRAVVRIPLGVSSASGTMDESRGGSKVPFVPTATSFQLSGYLLATVWSQWRGAHSSKSNRGGGGDDTEEESGPGSGDSSVLALTFLLEELEQPVAMAAAEATCVPPLRHFSLTVYPRGSEIVAARSSVDGDDALSAWCRSAVSRLFVDPDGMLLLAPAPHTRLSTLGVSLASDSLSAAATAPLEYFRASAREKIQIAENGNEVAAESKSGVDIVVNLPVQVPSLALLRSSSHCQDLSLAEKRRGGVETGEQQKKKEPDGCFRISILEAALRDLLKPSADMSQSFIGYPTVLSAATKLPVLPINSGRRVNRQGDQREGMTGEEDERTCVRERVEATAGTGDEVVRGAEVEVGQSAGSVSKLSGSSVSGTYSLVRPLPLRILLRHFRAHDEIGESLNFKENRSSTGGRPTKDDDVARSAPIFASLIEAPVAAAPAVGLSSVIPAMLGPECGIAIAPTYAEDNDDVSGEGAVEFGDSAMERINSDATRSKIRNDCNNQRPTLGTVQAMEASAILESVSLSEATAENQPEGGVPRAVIRPFADDAHCYRDATDPISRQDFADQLPAVVPFENGVATNELVKEFAQDDFLVDWKAFRSALSLALSCLRLRDEERRKRTAVLQLHRQATESQRRVAKAVSLLRPLFLLPLIGPPSDAAFGGPDGSPAVARLASGSLNSSVLPQLQCVLLAGAGLKMLPDAITSASHLLELELACNQLGKENGGENGKSGIRDTNEVLLPLCPSPGRLKGCSGGVGLPALQYLGLRDNALSVDAFPIQFASLEMLRHLDLAHNRLTKLPIGVTLLLPQLHRLDLSYNGLRSLQVPTPSITPDSNGMALRLSSILANEWSLLELRLSGNRLGGELALPKGAQWSCLINLRLLDASSNRLTSVPDEICALPQLSYLQLSRNLIVSLPQTFGDGTISSSLAFLSLERNQLVRLPEPSFCKLSALRYLYLGHNAIGELPRGMALAGLRSLEELDVSTNRLLYLPPGFALLSEMRRCNMQDNLLGKQEVLPPSAIMVSTAACNYGGVYDEEAESGRYDGDVPAFPPSLSGLRRLLDWDLSQNLLLRLPTDLRSLPALRSLGLSRNRICALPYWLPALTNLCELRLDDNPLRPRSLADAISSGNFVAPEERHFKTAMTKLLDAVAETLPIGPAAGGSGATASASLSLVFAEQLQSRVQRRQAERFLEPDFGRPVLHKNDTATDDARSAPIGDGNNVLIREGVDLKVADSISLLNPPMLQELFSRRVAAAITVMDTNGDGNVTRLEMGSALARTAPSLTPVELRRVLDFAFRSLPQAGCGGSGLADEEEAAAAEEAAAKGLSRNEMIISLTAVFAPPQRNVAEAARRFVSSFLTLNCRASAPLSSLRCTNDGSKILPSGTGSESEVGESHLETGRDQKVRKLELGATGSEINEKPLSHASVLQAKLAASERELFMEIYDAQLGRQQRNEVKAAGLDKPHTNLQSFISSASVGKDPNLRSVVSDKRGSKKTERKSRPVVWVVVQLASGGPLLKAPIGGEAVGHSALGSGNEGVGELRLVTVLGVKRSLERNEGFSSHAQILMFNGEKLQDKQLLSSIRGFRPAMSLSSLVDATPIHLLLENIGTSQTHFSS